MKTISRSQLLLAAGMATFTLAASAYACGGYDLLTLDHFATEAVSINPAVSTAAIRHLRSAGPAGLDALFRVHQGEIDLARLANLRVPRPADESWNRLKAALEAVAQQRDCEASRLFWYTNLADAEAAAAVSGKPILSLRLLGNLNEEYSCANSRFFRTTLYANAEVSSYLREHFVLHWKSVRPIPRITVDFGDGRRIERTITGNSIHYVLDSKGRVVDGLPGLYGPRAFLKALQQAESVAGKSGGLNDDNRNSLLAEYHNASRGAIQAAWRRDLSIVQNVSALPSGFGGNERSVPQNIPKATFITARAPSAAEAGRVAASKTAIERPLLQPGRPAGRPGSERIENTIGDELWMKIAALHAEEAVLDDSSRTLIRSKSPPAQLAARVAEGKRLVENPLLRSLRNLEHSISEDTVRNEYTLHFRLHEWLAQEPSPDLNKLNSRVYAEMFLTPDSDPWLGLVPADTYSALDNDGLVVSATAPK
jgi:hypothetical protein